ncbi:MAG: translocation/assembly module TamB domain-containing protein [Psychromonas sp.]|nr:translocation/assembly module TamB domain-containing protein [Psychromonas sp.]
MSIKRFSFHLSKISFLYFILPIILLLLLTSALLFTHLGNELIIRGLKPIVPRLTIDLEQGSFFFSPKYKNISWIDDNAFNFEIKNVNYAFDWSCLPQSICLKSLTSSSTNFILYAIKKNPSTIKKIQNKSFRLDLPLPIKFENLALQNTHFELHNVISVDLKSINVSASGDGDEIATNSTANGLIVTLPAKKKTAKSTRTKSHDVSAVNHGSFPAILNPSSLVDVVLPFELDVHKFILHDFLLEQGKVPIFSINKIQTAFSFKKSLVKISHLNTDLNELNLDLSGQIKLVKRYPFTLKANGIIKNIKKLQPANLLKGVTYKLKGEGDLSSLKTNITLIDPRLRPQLVFKAQTKIDLLSNNIPYNLGIEWKNLRWPLRGKPQVSSMKGQLYSKGDLDNYQLNAQTDYHVNNIPKGEIYLAGQGNLNKINLDSLLVKTLNGDIKLTGKLGWKHNINWAGLLEINKIDITQLNDRYHGVFSGKIKQTGSMKISDKNKLTAWKFDFPKIDINGKFLKHSFLINGKVSGNQTMGIMVSNLVIKNASNKLLINGHLAKNNNLKVNLMINDLSKIELDSEGEMTGTVLIKGPEKALNISTNLRAKNISYKQNKLQSLQVSSDLILLNKPILSASILANNLLIDGKTVDSIKLGVKESTLSTANTRKHVIHLAVKSKIASTNFSFNVQQRKNTWLAFINTAKIFVQKQTILLDQPFQIKLHKNNNISLSKHCWGAFDVNHKRSGSLCLDKFNVGKEGDIKFRIHNYLLVSMDPFLPKALNLKGAISSDGNIHWGKNKYPMFKININSDNMVVIANADKSKNQQIKFPVKTFAINLNGNKHINVNADILSVNLINAKVNTTIFPYKNKSDLKGKIQLNLPNLSPFAPLIIQIKKLSGSLNTNLTLNGTIKKPIVNGVVKLNDVRLSSEALPLIIKKFNATAIVNGQHATFQGLLSTGSNISTMQNNDVIRKNLISKSFSFINKSIIKSIHPTRTANHNTSQQKLNNIKLGTAIIKGYIDWKKHYKGKLELVANKIELYEYRKIDLIVTPKITLHIGKKLDLSGHIKIDQGSVIIKSMPEGAIVLSKDIVVVDEKRKTMSRILPLKINLDLNLGKHLKIEAYGLKSHLAGELLINKEKTKDLNLHGEIRVVSGSYRALGQQLILRKSRINFIGPPESPYISIEAIRDPEKISDGVIAGVRVTGLPDNLKLVIFSEPTMSQQNTLSYIMTGKSLDKSTDTTNSQIAGLLIDIGAGQSHAKNLVHEVGNKVGIKDLSISSQGDGDEQSIGLKGYILPGVQLSYGVGIFDNFTILSMNYEVFENFYIEISNGLYQAIDAYYNFDLN